MLRAPTFPGAVGSGLSTADSYLLMLFWPPRALRGLRAQLTPWTVPEQGISCLMHPATGTSWSAPVGLCSYLPSPHLSITLLLEVIREQSVGTSWAWGDLLGLVFSCRCCRGDSCLLGVAAGTNQPLVWGRVGDDLSHRPFRWDVLLLWKHVTNHLWVGVFPANRNISPLLPALHASWYSSFYPPGSWIPVMQSEMRGSLRYRDWYQNSLLLGSQWGSSCCVWQKS